MPGLDTRQSALACVQQVGHSSQGLTVNRMQDEDKATKGVSHLFNCLGVQLVKQACVPSHDNFMEGHFVAVVGAATVYAIFC